MIHVTSLAGDYFFYDEEKYEMIGETTGRVFKLGQKVVISVLGVDRLKRTIDFELVEDDNEEDTDKDE
jgi:ribonuclease R